MKKLHLYGIHPKIVSWIESFLTDHKQAVVVGGKLSVLTPIISGVPQDMVLGPILFLIFINGIEYCISSSIVGCFADDTYISISIMCENDVTSEGTVLGPILFLIFINGVEYCISSSIVGCFADDTHISISIMRESDVKLLQDNLHNVISWSERNKHGPPYR